MTTIRASELNVSFELNFSLLIGVYWTRLMIAHRQTVQGSVVHCTLQSYVELGTLELDWQKKQHFCKGTALACLEEV